MLLTISAAQEIIMDVMCILIGNNKYGFSFALQKLIFTFVDNFVRNYYRDEYYG